MPYSCKLLGFKSRMLPCMQVLQLDGRAHGARRNDPEARHRRHLRHHLQLAHIRWQGAL